MKKDVTRLIQEDHVVGIIGSLHSGNINATGQIVEDAKIPEVGSGLGDSSMGNLEVAEVAGSAAHDCYFSAQYIIPATIEEETDETLKAFYQAYMDKYGEMPTSDTGLRTYDAMQIMFKGIENAGSTDGTAIRDGITAISGLSLLGGTFDFTDGTGEGIHQQRLFVMGDGTIKPYEG